MILPHLAVTTPFMPVHTVLLVGCVTVRTPRWLHTAVAFVPHFAARSGYIVYLWLVTRLPLRLHALRACSSIHTCGCCGLVLYTDSSRFSSHRIRYVRSCSSTVRSLVRYMPFVRSAVLLVIYTVTVLDSWFYTQFMVHGSGFTFTVYASLRLVLRLLHYRFMRTLVHCLRITHCTACARLVLHVCCCVLPRVLFCRLRRARAVCCAVARGSFAGGCARAPFIRRFWVLVRSRFCPMPYGYTAVQFVLRQVLGSMRLVLPIVLLPRHTTWLFMHVPHAHRARLLRFILFVRFAHSSLFHSFFLMLFRSSRVYVRLLLRLPALLRTHAFTAFTFGCV